MKNLQIGIEDSMVSYLDRIADEQHKTRSAVIREALKHWIKQSAVDRFESQWIEALKKGDAQFSDDSELWMAAEEWD